MEGYQRPSVWQCLDRGDRASEAGAQAAVIRDLDNSIISGFQLASLSGPMCEEPLMGVCFSVERWDIQTSALPQHQDSLEKDSISHEALADIKVEGSSETSAQAEGTAAEPSQARRRPEAASADCYGPVSGQLIAAMKEACRHAFQAQPQRLMAAMYTCEIMATAEVLGKRALSAHYCHTTGSEINTRQASNAGIFSDWKSRRLSATLADENVYQNSNLI